MRGKVSQILRFSCQPGEISERRDASARFSRRAANVAFDLRLVVIKVTDGIVDLP